MSWIITGSEKNPVDLFRSNVSLLLHGDGTNGSTTIVDSSPTPKTVTANSAQISTAQSKFGGSSILLTGSSSALRLARQVAFDFGTADFTIELWLYPTSVAATSNIWSQRTSASNGISFRLSASKLNFFYDNLGTGSFSGATSLLNNTWQHVALTRQGNNFKLWLDGQLDGTSAAISADVTSTIDPKVGAAAGTSNVEAYSGYIDDLRITKGIARYTASFTPPTAPFPDI
jgi:hypothetical protein